ncbi:MAG: hypothetical protein IJK49_09525 [Prevotella sp.]|nr:hypothetical protein [Prevotella sp.]
MKNTIVLKLLCLLLAGMSLQVGVAGERKAARIVNFVNFVRDIEPRDAEITPEVLYQTVKEEADAIHRFGFRGTWLLQYDALIDSRYQPMMREELKHGCEVGGWWEITQPHVEAAGLKWRGRFPWDWHADKGFSVGYTQEERRVLVDVYMAEFKKIFGQLPKSIGSWFIDAYTLEYMQREYGVEGCCMCRDQIGTDGYTLWGGYWAGAYYPSRVNSYMPAQSREGQIDLPVFRMLGSDPLYQYSAGIGGAVQSVCTMEPTYENAQVPEWVAWYLRCMTDDPALGFTYLQAGQENSFTWDAFKKGYEVQLPQIAELERQGKLRVETLIETARAFRKKYAVTPATACSAMRDYTDNDGRTVWFNSRYYRANILWQGDRMNIRDMHLFDEKKESYYYKNVCTSNQCVYMTLPIVDGCLWSTNELMAGLRLYGMTASGKMTELRGGEPEVRQSGKGIVVTWPVKDSRAVFTVKMTEESFSISCSDKTLDWCAQLDVQPEAQLPFKEIASNMLSASQDGFDYQMALRRGHFDTSLTAAGIGFRIIPEKSKIEIKTR